MEPLAAEDPRAVGEFRLRARLGAGRMGRVFLGFSLAGRAARRDRQRRDDRIRSAGGVVYVGSLDSSLYALRATDGAVLWRFPAGGPIATRAAVADGLVYIGSGDGNIYAVQA